MIHKFCKLCLQPVLATDWKAHILQRQHLQQLPCKIIVKGSFTKDQVDQVYEYFAKFGGIRSQDVTFVKKDAVIEYRFWDARVYSEVIHQEHTLFDQQVGISWYRKVKAGPLKLVTQDEKMEKEKFVYRKLAILNGLKEPSTLIDQLKIFQNKMNEIKNEMEKNRKKIQNDLTTTLSSNFHRSKSHFYGSSITELDIYDSDVNIYLDGTDSKPETLESIKDLINKSESFANAFVNTTKTSIKFQHTKTQVFCELSIKNELPVGSSELIKYYLTLDEKLRDLMLLIKFWADCYELRGENFFSSYSLYIMVIFYLQQAPYNLPSVAELQKDLPPDEIDGWNCAFGPVEFTNPNLENATTFELTTNFFRFYSSFDYISQVISPYFGSAIYKTDFMNSQNLPDCFENYKNHDKIFEVNEAICVQDFFQHSKNVSLVSLSCSGKFTAACRQSLQIDLSDEKHILYRLMFNQNNNSNEFCLTKEEKWDDIEWILTVRGSILRTLKENFGFEVQQFKSDVADVVIYSCKGANKILGASDVSKDRERNRSGKILVVVKFESDPCRASIEFKENENLPALHIQHYIYIMLIKLLTETNIKKENSTSVDIDVKVGGTEIDLEIVKQENPIPVDIDVNLGNIKIDLEIVKEENPEERVFITNSVAKNAIKTEKTVRDEMEIDNEIILVENCTKNENQSIKNEFINENLCDKLESREKNETENENLCITKKDVEKPFSDNREVERENSNLPECRTNLESADEVIDLVSPPNSFLSDENTQESENRCETIKIETTCNKNDSPEENLFSAVTFEKTEFSSFEVFQMWVKNNLLKIPTFERQIAFLMYQLEAYNLELSKKYQFIHEDLTAVLTPILCESTMQFFPSGVSEPHLKIYIAKALESDSETSVLIKNTISNCGKFLEISASGEKPKTQFIHIQTNIVCEFITRNKMKCVELVNYYLDLDDKIRKCVNVIELWASFYGARGITSHSFYLCVIFYLQHDPYSLPSVAELQKEISPEMENGWNCAFACEKNVNAILQNATILELIEGFFKFYEKFDYITYVICPYLGRGIEKLRFLKPYDLPEEYKIYMSQDQLLYVDGIVTIQDPFEHTCDLAFAHHEFARGQFTQLFRNCTQLMTSDRENLLYRFLFDAQNHDSVDLRTFYINKNSEEADEEWYSRIKFVITNIFTEILACTVQELAISPTAYYLVIRHKFDVFIRRTWNLKIVTTQLPDTATESEKEIAVTKRIIQNTPRYIDTEMYLFVTFLINPSRVKLFFSGDNRSLVLHVDNFVKMKFEKFLMDLSELGKEESLATVSNEMKAEQISEGDCEKLREEVASKIREAPTFVEQISVFLNSLKENRSMFQKKSSIIYNDLTLEFGSQLKEISFYGSNMFELHTKDGIVDIFVDVNKVSKSNSHLLNKTKKFLSPTLEEQDGTRILKCTHAKTQLKCFINMTKKLWVYSSELVKYYVNLDIKIYQLFIFVKFWAQVHDLKLSNYALYLMVIFFLQQKPYNLPSIASLQEGTNSQMVNGWNCSFKFPTFQSPALQKVTILKLVSDFFEFYGSFDYFTYVISPYSGLLIRKTFFIKPCTLPHVFQNYVDNKEDLPVESCLCIQDLLELSKNVVSSVSSDLSGIFASLCRTSYSCIKNGEKDLFYQLVTHPTSCDFTINKCLNLNDDKWTQFVHQLFLKIFKKILYHKVDRFEAEEGTFYIFEAKSLRPGAIKFWKDQVKQSWDDLDDWEKNRILAFHIFNVTKTGAATKFQLIFEQNPSRMIVSFTRNVDFIFHYVHFFYTRLPKFLKEIEVQKIAQENSRDLECIKEGATFTNQVNIFQTKLLSFREEVIKLHQLISDDLYSILKAKFPEVQVYFYNTSLDLPQKNLNIYLNNVCSDEKLDYMVNLLCSSSHFNNVSRIPEGEFSVTCEHVTSKVSCNLNVKNKLVIVTSDLIKFYANMDDKVSLLMMIIKAWIEFHEEEISNDLLFLMVIFFLQHTYKIPSVEELQKDAPIDPIDGWNCAYTRIVSLDPLKSVPFFDLLSGFFKFYADFNYSSFMICPYLGKLIRKSRFLKPFDLPKCFQEYINRNEEIFIDSILTVQDPFQHNTNIAHCFVYKTLGNFAYLCHNAYRELEHEKSLYFLLNVKNVSQQRSYTIEKNENVDEKEWKEKVKTLTSTILKRVFDCEIEEKIEHGQIFYVCSKLSEIWANRVSAEKTLILPEEISDLDREIAVTSIVKKQFLYASKKPFSAVIEFLENPFRVIVIVKTRHIRRMKSYISHFIYLRLFNALNNHKIEIAEEIPPVKFEKLQTSILTSLETVDTLDEQLAILQEQYRDSENDIEEYCAMIESDLKLLLPIKKVVFNSKIINLHVKHTSLEIYLMCETTLDNLKDLISKSESFCDCVITASEFIKCKHVKTGIICDVNVTYRFSEQTSQLIKYYLHLDNKLYTLMTVIKFWADSHKMTGLHRFTDSALYMLIIFFLQHEPYNLPSVVDLQRDTTPNFIDGWNCAFSVREFTNLALQKATILELIAGFFKFYSTYDYISYVISPYFGSAIEKTRFLKPYDLPECYKEYMSQEKELSVDTSICIQDFFEHSRNVSSVLFYLPGQFTYFCQRFLRTIIEDDCKWLENIVSYDCWSYTLYFNSVENLTVEVLAEFLNRVFVHIFGCTISSYSLEAQCAQIELVGKYNIWNNRIESLKKVLKSVDKFDREVAATKLIIENVSQKLVWGISYRVETNSDGELQIRFKKTIEFNQLLQIMHFIYMRLLETFPELQALKRNEVDNCMEVSEDLSLVDENESMQVENVQSITNENKNENLVNDEKSPSITPEENTNMNIASSVEESSIETDPIVAATKNITTFDEQLNTLCSILQPDSLSERNKKISIISNELANAVHPQNLFFFGSRLTRLDIRSSDLNMNIVPQSPDISLDCHKKCISDCGKFKDVTKVYNMKVRGWMLECVHLETQIRCEFVFSNRLVVRNSELLEYYCDLDHKLRTVLIMIHFWVERHGLTAGNFFPKYALNLMMIFYLQHAPYRVPSVLYLQKMSSPLLVDGWNCAFDKAPLTTPELTGASVLDLAKGFFMFYGDFDFFSFVIAPFFGSPIAKTRFLQPFNLPDEYQAYTRQNNVLEVNKVMCIQDPFEHSHNVTASVSHQAAAKFAVFCRRAYELLREEPRMLHGLLCLDNFDQISDFTLERPAKIDEIKWNKLIKNLMKMVLTKIFACNITRMETLDSKTELYECTGSYNVWDNRTSVLKNVLKGLNRNANNIDKEIAVTAEFIKNNKNSKCWKSSVTVTFKDPSKVLVTMRGEDNIYYFCHFMYTKLRQFLNEESSTSVILEYISSASQQVETSSNEEVEKPNAASVGVAKSIDKKDCIAQIAETSCVEVNFDSEKTKVSSSLTLSPSIQIAPNPECQTECASQAQKVATVQVDSANEEVESVGSKGGNSISLTTSLVSANPQITSVSSTSSISSVTMPPLIAEPSNIASTEKQMDSLSETPEVEFVQVNSGNENVELTSANVTSLASCSTQSVGNATRADCQIASVPSGSSVTKTSPDQSEAVASTSSTPAVSKMTKYTVLKSTKNKPTFAEQISYYAENLLISQEKLEEYKKIVHDDLTKILLPHFTFKQIFFFGSSAMGLFSEESNFDIYIDKLEKRSNVTKGVEFILKNSEEFVEVYFSTRSKTVQCRHKTTQISCEIFTRYKLMTCSSLLIRYYLEFDPKLRHFMFFMKIWADFYHLKAKAFMSNHSIYLMVIFYLQQEPYNLPSVADLQKRVTPDVVDGWNCAFGPTKFTSLALKNATILDLITGFFKFYGSFDYFSNVIAPFSGLILDKTRFLKTYQLPEVYTFYTKQDRVLFLDIGICVQDVFRHCMNVTSRVTLQSLGRFAALCRGAIQLISTGENQLLCELLTQCHFVQKVDYHSIEVEKPSNFDSNEWLYRIKNLIFIIITEVLCCNIINVNHEVLNRGSKTTRIGTKLRKGDVDRLVYKCVGQRNVWDKRVNILKAWMSRIYPHASCVDKDVFVSRFIMTDNKRTMAWDMHIEVDFVTNPGSMRLRILGDKMLFITHFFYTRILSVTDLAQVKAPQVEAQTIGLNPLLSSFCKPYKVRVLFRGILSEQSLNMVHGYFSKFGNFENCSVNQNGNKCSIEYCFANPTIYLQVITQEHRLFDQKLKLIPLAHLKNKVVDVNFPNFRLAVIHKVAESSNFTDQMNVLKKVFELKKKEIEERQKIIEDDLNSALSRKLLNRVKITSNVLTLDLENETLLFYVDREVVPTLVPLKAIKDSIYEDPNFSSVYLIRQNSNSIIKFKQTNTQTFCDIKIRSKSTVIVNKLLKYYLSLDPKLELFMMAIKFWTDSYDLSEDHSFSDYAIYLMVIFYLQQEPYKLPSVKDLQQNIVAEVSDGWNYSYAELIEFENSALKEASFFDLVSGFFRFYSKFDYVTYVISPYLGAAIEKICFLKPYTLPPCFDQFISLNVDVNMNTGLFVQDVFNHSWNVSSSVSLDSAGRFTSLCRSAMLLMEQGESFLLHKLFLHCENETLVQFPGFIIEKSQEKEEEEWIQTVKTLTLRILSDILLYKLTQIPEFGTRRVSYGCIGQDDVWNNRISFMKTLSTQLTGIRDFAKETAATTCAAKDFSQKPCWNILVQLTFVKNPCSVKVLFTNKSGCFEMYHVCHFVYTRLMKFLGSGDDGVKVEGTASTSSTIPEPNTCVSDANTVNSSEKTAADMKTGDNNVTNIYETTADDGKRIENTVETHERNESATHCKSETSKQVEGEITNDNEEDDDIPADFFDDFARDDFLDGFSVCDSWESDVATNESKKHSESTSRTPTGKKHKRTRSNSRDRWEDECEKKRKCPLDKRDVRRSPRKCESTYIEDRGRLRSPKSDKRTKRRSRSPQPSVFRRKKTSEYRSRRRGYSRRSSASESDSYSPPPKSRRHQEVKKRKSFLEEINEKLDELAKSKTLLASNNQSMYGSMVQFPVISVGQPSTAVVSSPVITSCSIPPPLMAAVAPTPVHYPLVPAGEFCSTVPPIFCPGVSAATFPSANCNPPVLPPMIQTYPGTHFPDGTFSQTSFTPLQPVQVLEKTIETVSVSSSSSMDLETASDVEQFTHTAEREDKTREPPHLQKKYKVFSHCQEVIKVMTNDSQSTGGRLIVKVSPSENKQRPKYQSPLKKITSVRFNFTTPPPTLPEGESAFSKALDVILQAAGVANQIDKTEVECDVVETVTEKLSDKVGVSKNAILRVLKETLLGVNCEFEQNVSVATQCLGAAETSHASLQVGGDLGLTKRMRQKSRMRKRKGKKKKAAFKKGSQLY